MALAGCMGKRAFWFWGEVSLLSSIDAGKNELTKSGGFGGFFDRNVQKHLSFAKGTVITLFTFAFTFTLTPHS